MIVELILSCTSHGNVLVVSCKDIDQDHMVCAMLTLDILQIR